MKPMNSKSKSISIACLVLGSLVAMPMAACGNKDAPASMTPEAGTAYTNEETLTVANDLVTALEMPDEKQVKVLKKLQKLLDDPNERPAVNEQVRTRGITGVVAYRLGEGGAVLTVKSGKAFARLKGQSGNTELKLSGADLGAQVAASREWGIGLVLGLPEGETIEGKYRGLQKSAAAGAGNGAVTLKPKRGGHSIVFLGAGSGVSLDVSGSRLKIKPVG